MSKSGASPVAVGKLARQSWSEWSGTFRNLATATEEHRGQLPATPGEEHHGQWMADGFL